MSEKVDFGEKSITMNKEGYCIMIQGPFHQENRAIIYLYVPNNRASKYMEQKVTKIN